MAKYDTYELSVTVADGKAQYTSKVSVLFEEGDTIDSVLLNTSDRLRAEAIRLKTTTFLKSIQ